MTAYVREAVAGSLAYTASTKVNTLTTSSAPQVGDVLAVIYQLDYGQLDQSQGPTPGGWISQVIASINGAAPYTRCWTSPVTQSGVQTVSITQTDQFTDSNMVLLVIAGADPTTPVDTSSWASGSHATAHPTFPLTPTYPNELVIFAWGSGINSGDTGTYALPAGVTAVANTSSSPYSTLAVGSMVAATTAQIPAKTATFTRSTSPTTAVSYADIALTFRSAPVQAAGGVTSALGLTNTVTATKGVTVAVTSVVDVAGTPTPSKVVNAAVTSQVGLASVVGEAPDVRALPAGGPLDISLWVLDSADNYVGPLPDYQKVTLSPVANSAGSISIDYPAAGLNWHLLHDIILGNRDLELAVWVGGRDEGSLRALVLEGQGDEVSEQAVWTFTGAFLEHRMTEAVVYPPPPDPTNPQAQPEVQFSDLTAGQIMGELMIAAQARGALTDIRFDTFTGYIDSNGARWSTSATMKVSPGADYLAMLGTLADVGLCEFELTKEKQLRLYEPGTRGVDRTLATLPVILRAARDITDAPRKYSIRDSATDMVVSGGNGLSASVTDPAARARRGRRVERYASQNQIIDTGALTAFGQAELGSRAHGRMELTHGLSFGPGSALPIADFNLADWVWSDNGNGLERLRVQQWTITQDEHGVMTGSATLGDLIDEHDLQVARRLAAITSGTTVVGTSTPEPTPTNQAKTPATPTGLVCSSLVYTDLGPPVLDSASVFCGWTPVTTNTDGTALSAGGISYRVRYRYTDVTTGGMPMPDGWVGTPDDHLPWIAGGSSTTATLQFSGLSAGRPIQVQVAAAIALDPSTQPYEFDSLNRAFRRTSLQSPWSAGFDLTTAADATPPLVPSMPTATTGPGSIARIVWDGLSAEATVLAQASPDLAFVEVHVSATSNFTPDTTTFRDRFYGPGTTVVTDILYQVGYFVRLVAVDQGGNRSDPSVQTTFTAHELLSQDLFAQCVGSAQLAYAAVKTANIDQLAVNDAQIGSLAVGKLVSGVGTFDMLLAGRIRTGNVGARIELDNYSFRQYAVDGTTLTTQLISATGEALITGLIRTGVTGKRVEMSPDGTWKLYPASGTGYNAIFNNGNEVVFRGLLDSQGRSGYLRISAAGIASQFGIPGQSVTAQLSVGSANIDLTSPINGLRSDKRFATANGNPYNNLLIFNDAAGADIGNSVIQHSQWNTNGTGWGCTGRNTNMVFDNGTDSTNRVHFVYNDGNYADIHCGNVYAPNVTAPSGRAMKHRITDIPYEPLDVIRRSPAKQWQYREDALPVNPPDEQGPWMLRRRKDGTDKHTGHADDFEWAEHDRPGTSHELSYVAARRVGPMADDIAQHAPHMVHEDAAGQLHLSLGDQIGVLWAAIERLADKVDQLTDKHHDIPELPGRRPPRG